MRKFVPKDIPLWLTAAAGLQYLACSQAVPQLSLAAIMCVLVAGVLAADKAARATVRENPGGVFIVAGALTLWLGCALHIPQVVATTGAFVWFGIAVALAVRSARHRSSHLP